jgi:uncharacterized membrane protein HdeD (DUF308 family)
MNSPKVAGRRMTAFGIIAMILGVLAMLMPVLAGASMVWFLGLVVLGAGIARMIWAFQAGSFGRGVLLFAIGGLTLLCGLALMAHPLFASAVLTIVLAAYLIVDGVAEIAAGVQLPSGAGKGWLIFGGIVSILLGILFWAQFPLAGIWAMGVLLGIKLFVVGLIMLMGGSAVRSS